jgi:hypothetical protein
MVGFVQNNFKIFAFSSFFLANRQISATLKNGFTALRAAALARSASQPTAADSLCVEIYEKVRTEFCGL